MAKAELKTKATKGSVEKFLRALDPDRRRDCETLVRLLSRVTKAPPKMWGKAIVGFGDLHMKYESGRELDWFVAGFSPRKKDLTLYLMGRPALDGDLGERLGKHSSGKGCLYIQKLADVDLGVLEEIARQAARNLKQRGR
jgi:Domain of unknown function (DU1801)